MRTFALLPLAAMAVLGLSGCGSTSLLHRNAPNELAVTHRPPLVIPPDFALKPPEAGTAEAQSIDLQRATLEALFGGPAPRSSGETSLLDAAGRDLASAGIRSNVGDPDTNVVDKGAVTRDIVAAPEGDGQFAKASVGQ